MNFFELTFCGVPIALIVFASRALGNVFGLTAWVFAIPIILPLVVGFRLLSIWLSKRRLRNSIFGRKNKNQDD